MNYWFFWEICVNIITNAVQFYLLYRLLGVAKKKYKYMLMGLVLIIVFVSTLNYIDIQMAVPIASGFTIYTNRFIVTGAYLIIIFLVFEGTTSSKIILGLVTMFVGSISDFVALITAASATNTDTNSVSQFGSNRFFITLIYITIVILTSIALIKLFKNKSAKNKLFIPQKIQITLIIILLLGTISVDILIDNIMLFSPNGTATLNTGEIILAIAFLFIIFFVFILITKVGVLSYENIEYMLEVQKVKSEQSYFKDVEIAIKEIRDTKHDMRHHLHAMQALFTDKEYSELAKYFESVNGLLSKQSEIIYTKNKTLNSIIQSKALLMKTENIPFFHHISEAESLPISPFNMCSILGNLLDNAIEASQKIAEDKRYVNITIKRKQQILIIQIENAFNGIFNRIDKNKFFTNKQGEGHGLGISHVEKTVIKHKGHMQINVQNSIFEVSIFLSYLSEDRYTI